MAFGAPRLLFSGLAVAVGEDEGVAVADGLSLGSGVGEESFFGLADALGEGEACFFFAEAPGEGDADFFFDVDFRFLCGVGVGVGVDKTFLIFSPRVSSAACADAMTSNAKATKMAKRIMRLTSDVTLTSSTAAVKVVLQKDGLLRVLGAQKWASPLRYAQLCRQFLEHRFVNANSSIEVFQREILVRRVCATVRQCESQQQCFRAENLTKIRHDRYTAAFANQDRIALERFL